MEIREVACGLYILDEIVAGRPNVLNSENDYGLLYWNSDPAVRAEYVRRRTLVNDDFVHPRQVLAFARLVGAFGI